MENPRNIPLATPFSRAGSPSIVSCSGTYLASRPCSPSSMRAYDFRFPTSLLEADEDKDRDGLYLCETRSLNKDSMITRKLDD